MSRKHRILDQPSTAHVAGTRDGPVAASRLAAAERGQVPEATVFELANIRQPSQAKRGPRPRFDLDVPKMSKPSLG